jgi:hypothetical protein
VNTGSNRDARLARLREQIAETRARMAVLPGVPVASNVTTVAATAIPSASARPAAIATPAVPPSAAPTHLVPPAGLPSWDQPDGARPMTPLAGGLALEVVQRIGDWAQVRASNGWVGWVDGRRLLAKP